MRRLPKRLRPLLRATKSLTLKQLRQHLWGVVGRDREQIPIPGPLLMFSVGGTADVDWFLNSGRLARSVIDDALARIGMDDSSSLRVLDFGCGCGRVLRYWDDAKSGRLHGCDTNQRSVGWIRRHLPWVKAFQNTLHPPLNVPSSHFDLIYAFSVFTHLTEELMIAWLEEMGRLLSAGGILLFSTHGDAYRSSLSPEEVQTYVDDRVVVRFGDEAGDNICGAYHPPGYIRTTLPDGFDILEHVAEGALGNPKQDLWVVRNG